MTQVDVRANVPVLGMPAGRTVYGVELTPMLERAAADGKVTITAEYPAPDPVECGTDCVVEQAGGFLRPGEHDAGCPNYAASPVAPLES